jgi:hypothetical protein
MELEYTKRMVATIVIKFVETDGGEETVPTHSNAAAHNGAEVDT